MEEFQLRMLIENVVTIAAILIIMGFVALGPVGRAIARRIEGKPLDQGALDEVQDRIAVLEHSQMQMAELAERLDFAERLLAQRSEPARLEPGA